MFVEEESHGEDFYPVRSTLGEQEVEFGWDSSLRDPPRRPTSVVSRWLREDPGDGVRIGMELDKEQEGRKFGEIQIAKPYWINKRILEGYQERKKMQGVQGEGQSTLVINEANDSKDPNEISMATRKQISSWNVYDLGKKQAVGHLKNRADDSRSGLPIGWKDDVGVTLRSFSRLHIDVEDSWGNGLYGRGGVCRETTLERDLIKEWLILGGGSWMFEDGFEEQVVARWVSSEWDFLARLDALGSKLGRWASMNKAVREDRKQGLYKKLRELNEVDPINEVVSCRKKRNTVRGLDDESGEWVSAESEIVDVATKYFQDLFTSKLVRGCNK
ncbi:hypothetical protein GOBAR_DD31804 [Gossypium barbadense]|nr:hypothetical protein GOBAR_DD31804 [Gossypium barbadense]